jgi:mono/diheme cytochrome c family protein
VNRIDPTQGNAGVPSNCLTCHGGEAQVVDGHLVGAQFLPFDLENFRFGSAAPFDRASQEDSFRRLNGLVVTTVNTTASDPSNRLPLAKLILGWYEHDNKHIGDSNQTFADGFVPDGWASAKNTGQPVWTDGFYTSVIQPYCQGCHITQKAFDFSSYATFNPFGNLALQFTCGDPGVNATPAANAHLMPHAEMTMKHFWESGARGQLLAAYGTTASRFNGCGSTQPNQPIH